MCGFDFTGTLEDTLKMSQQSVLLLHACACAHSPAGVDPRPEQRKEIATVVKKNSISWHSLTWPPSALPAVMATRTPGLYATSLNRAFILVSANPIAKNRGLYWEHVGAVTVVGQDAEAARSLESQLKILIRPMYSNPP
ncbi:hypothetical protein GH733_013845 [Mirounga leonina]|nr:hypothetical protein GH733_013845 [Mirounga leonina]